MSNGNKILVTGGAGYIGSHTVVELINNGFEPIIVDDFRNAHKTVLEGIHHIVGQELQIAEVDVCDINALRAVFNKYQPQGIIHFAAYKAVGESVERPLMYYHNNVNGLINCLELCAEFGVQNFVFSSSCTVYGEPDESAVITEKSPLKPANSPYGATKQIGERILEDFVASKAAIKVLNLRYFNPVGAHKSALIGEYPIGRPNNLFPIITQTAIGKNKEFKVHGNDYNTPDGTCIRDYVHVCDVAEAHVRGVEWLMKQSTGTLETLNIGTGKGTSVMEIIHTFEKISDLSFNWTIGPRRTGDVEQIFADVNKANQLLNWKATRTVEDAVRDAWNWEKQLANA